MTITQTIARPSWMVIAATTEATLAVNRTRLFDFVTAEDVLPKILTRYKLIPAVAATSGNLGPWNRPGSIRTVRLADGTSVLEELTAYDRPGYFSCHVSQFTFAVRHLATDATAEWWFEEDGAGARLRWTYVFQAKGPLTAMMLALFVKKQWLGYMRTCIENIERLCAGP